MSSEAQVAAVDARAEGLALDGLRRVAFTPASGRFVMVVNPKAACSSFKYAVWEAEHRHGLTPFPPPPARARGAIHRREKTALPRTDMARLSGLIGGTPFYTVVRNPYTRLLSAWLDKIAGDKKEKRGLLLRMGYTSNRPIPFDAFVEFVAATASSELDPHWAPQAYLTQYRFLPYAGVGAVEDLGRFLRHLLARHYGEAADGGETIRAYRPHSTGASAALGSHYTPRTLALVRRRYADDFALFGYPEDPARAGEAPQPPAAPVTPGGEVLVRAALAGWNAVQDGGTRRAVPGLRRHRDLVAARAVLAAAPQGEAGLLALAGRVDLALGRSATAEDLLRRAIAAGSDEAATYTALASCLVRQGRRDQAMAAVADAVAIAGLSPLVLRAAARLAAAAGRTEAALRYGALASLPPIDLAS
ncbi:sulfotransferase family 2 domain-containing protein [Novispirillum sp. DQ9]|uniref:sulfotransferase family 2 domain-containing protein n=1 Tax=Novispirillum sp. DQ9 TaxID=3398612 RepID=UPI003C79732A